MPATLSRKLQPELLDLLPEEDPRVLRCRRDLRLINWFMGNHRWILRTLGRFEALAQEGIVELGAGDGMLLERLRRRFPRVPLTGFDLAARPVSVPQDVSWRDGDLVQHEGSWPGRILIANLFLHHLTHEQIASLGRRLDGVKVLMVGEGHRCPDVLRRSRWLNPFLGEVTRHDMEISLAAGFVAGELPGWLGLSEDDWEISESSTLFGSHRLLAVRRA